MDIKFKLILGTLFVVVATILLYVSDTQGGRNQAIYHRRLEAHNQLIRSLSGGDRKFCSGRELQIGKEKFRISKIIKEKSDQIIAEINYRLVISTQQEYDLPHITTQHCFNSVRGCFQGLNPRPPGHMVATLLVTSRLPLELLRCTLRVSAVYILFVTIQLFFLALTFSSKWFNIT